MSRFIPLALAVASAIPALVHAQNGPANSKLEEIIVVSSRVEMPLRQIGTSVSVITETDIQARGFNSLYDVLRTQPAIAVSNSGGAGSATSVRVRGKNYRTFQGQPLCYWVLKTLRACQRIDQIVVDTDSDQIRQMLTTDFPNAPTSPPLITMMAQ